MLNHTFLGQGNSVTTWNQSESNHWWKTISENNCFDRNRWFSKLFSSSMDLKMWETCNVKCDHKVHVIDKIITQTYILPGFEPFFSKITGDKCSCFQMFTGNFHWTNGFRKNVPWVRPEAFFYLPGCSDEKNAFQQIVGDMMKSFPRMRCLPIWYAFIWVYSCKIPLKDINLTWNVWK